MRKRELIAGAGWNICRAIGLIVILISGSGQTGSQSDPCGCFTPARTPSSPPVRFGWGGCPGNKQPCDWCYGPNAVFAYSPRGSVYTLTKYTVSEVH